MKNITVLEFRKFHPEEVQTKTDLYFTSVANKILQKLLLHSVITNNFGIESLKLFSIKSAAHFEDVISQ